MGKMVKASPGSRRAHWRYAPYRSPDENRLEGIGSCLTLTFALSLNVLALGADVSRHTSPFGRTALMAAARNDQSEAIVALLAWGV